MARIAEVFAELRGVKAETWAVVLKSSGAPTSALRFARFLASPDRGGLEFAKSGYQASGGDAWAEKPTLLLYGGAMLRPAIEKTITAFEQREGCEVTRVYNGCGILVAQMKAGARPDLYFACDTQFMKDVQDQFGTPVDVSLTLLDALHERWVVLLRSLAAADFQRTFIHPEQGRAMTLDRTLALYAWHGRHHTGHVRQAAS